MPSSTPIRSFMRTATRYLSEPHPHGRHPATMVPHRHYAPFFMRRMAGTAAWYFPVGAVLLGWPFMTSAVLKKTGF
ncbi:hypothetical protein K432DRAFT_296708 [Lepidopterella palustris CBS 459.81]|uniref:Uncharacterized protein n=1 Tax=Lepidopterella palustris CBS 459.81 TaxID=1314670 RepID=A0A8E2JGC0_9PEZI|nr:hypothetical protein K432DRAFT_296708 [Lepidopterella palustris CBS 459.81]